VILDISGKRSIVVAPSLCLYMAVHPFFLVELVRQKPLLKVASFAKGTRTEDGQQKNLNPMLFSHYVQIMSKYNSI
jgi:hypothetical protein